LSSENKVILGCGFHHVSMKVRDLDKSIKFYREGLGFVERFSWGQAPRRTVLLDTGDGNYFEISQGGQDQVGVEGFFRHVALRTDDCEAALESARSAGAEVTVETREVTLPTEPSMRLRIAFFKGPDGELIELFQECHT
jgi:glyoxylase I family protein